MIKGQIPGSCLRPTGSESLGVAPGTLILSLNNSFVTLLCVTLWKCLPLKDLCRVATIDKVYPRRLLVVTGQQSCTELLVYDNQPNVLKAKIIQLSVLNNQSTRETNAPHVAPLRTWLPLGSRMGVFLRQVTPILSHCNHHFFETSCLVHMSLAWGQMSSDKRLNPPSP